MGKLASLASTSMPDALRCAQNRLAREMLVVLEEVIHDVIHW
jgi:hypothetical protein